MEKESKLTPKAIGKLTELHFEAKEQGLCMFYCTICKQLNVWNDMKQVCMCCGQGICNKHTAKELLAI